MLRDSFRAVWEALKGSTVTHWAELWHFRHHHLTLMFSRWERKLKGAPFPICAGVAQWECPVPMHSAAKKHRTGLLPCPSPAGGCSPERWVFTLLLDRKRAEFEGFFLTHSLPYFPSKSWEISVCSRREIVSRVIWEMQMKPVFCLFACFLFFDRYGMVEQVTGKFWGFVGSVDWFILG